MDETLCSTIHKERKIKMSTVPKNPGILSNLRIHGILRTEEKNKTKPKGKENLLNEIMTENFLNLEKRNGHSNARGIKNPRHT